MFVYSTSTVEIASASNSLAVRVSVYIFIYSDSECIEFPFIGTFHLNETSDISKCYAIPSVTV